jgi:hypothetical protein
MSINLQDQFDRFEADENLLPDGTYTLKVYDAEAGNDYIVVFMETGDGAKTRIRLTFTSEDSKRVAFDHVNAFGITAADAPASVHDLAPMFVGRTVEAELGHWQRDGESKTFQTMKPWTVKVVAQPSE